METTPFIYPQSRIILLPILTEELNDDSRINFLEQKAINDGIENAVLHLANKSIEYKVHIIQSRLALSKSISNTLKSKIAKDQFCHDIKIHSLTNHEYDEYNRKNNSAEIFYYTMCHIKLCNNFILVLKEQSIDSFVRYVRTTHQIGFEDIYNTRHALPSKLTKENIMKSYNMRLQNC